MAARLSEAEKARRDKAKADRKAKADAKKAERDKKKADGDAKKAERDKKKADKEKRKADREAKKADRAKAKADREKKKADRDAKTKNAGAARDQKKTVAAARKQRRFKRKELRQGEKRARTTYRTGNASCRVKRREADAPHRAGIQRNNATIRPLQAQNRQHREGIKQNRVDYGKCRRAVEASTVQIVADLVPVEQELRALDALIPASIPNPRAGIRQDQWQERIDQARAEVLSQHPELATFLDQQLDPLGRYGSKASTALRAEIDRRVQGRPVMRLDEYLLQLAHEAGHSPTSGLAHAPSLQAAAIEAAERSVARRMLEGPPEPPAGSLHGALAALGIGPSSAAEPIGPLSASAFSFPGSPPSGSRGISETLISSVRGTVPTGAAAGRPARRGRSSSGAAPSSRHGSGGRRGEARTRAPRTKASGNQPRPRKASPTKKGTRK